jgi:hypothetical protein
MPPDMTSPPPFRMFRLACPSASSPPAWLAALAPQLPQLVLTELEAAGRARRDHAHAVLGQILLAHAGVGQRPVRRDERELCHPVRLGDQPAREVVRRGETGHLTGEPGWITGRVEPRDRADLVEARTACLPVFGVSEPVGRDDSQAGHDRRAGHVRPTNSMAL